MSVWRGLQSWRATSLVPNPSTRGFDDPLDGMASDERPSTSRAGVGEQKDMEEGCTQSQQHGAGPCGWFTRVVRFVALRLKWGRELDPYVKVVLLHSSGWTKTLRTKAVVNGGSNVVWRDEHRDMLQFSLPIDLEEEGAHFRLRLEVYDENINRDNLLGLRSRDIPLLTAVDQARTETWGIYNGLSEKAGSLTFSFRLHYPDTYVPHWSTLSASNLSAASNREQSEGTLPKPMPTRGSTDETAGSPPGSAGSHPDSPITPASVLSTKPFQSTTARSLSMSDPDMDTLGSVGDLETHPGELEGATMKDKRKSWVNRQLMSVRPRSTAEMLKDRLFNPTALEHKVMLADESQAKVWIRMVSAADLSSQAQSNHVNRSLAKMASVASVLYFAMGYVVYSKMEGWSFINCFYFSVVTLTTTGYGDLHPTKQGSKVFTCFFAFCGIGVITSALGLIGGYLFDEQQRVFMETMASVNMHKADRKHIHKFAPKNSTRRLSEEEQAAEKSKSEQKEGEKKSLKPPWVSVTKSLIHLKRGARVMNKEDEEDDTEGKPESVKKSSMLAQVTRYLVSIFVMVFLGVLVFSMHDGFSITDAFYLSCISLATVGYGDIYPKSEFTRLFTSIWLLCGTVIIAKAIGGTLSFVLDRQRRSIVVSSLEDNGMDFKQLMALDEDGDGLVTEMEFLTRMLVKLKKVKQTDIKIIMDTFRRLDKDGSGTLTEADLNVDAFSNAFGSENTIRFLASTE